MLQIIRRTANAFKICDYLISPPKRTCREISCARTYSTDQIPVGVEMDMSALTQGDPEIEHKLQVIMLETEVLKQEGRKVPSISFIKHHHWQELLALNTRTARRKYLDFLFKVEKKKENEAAKKEENRIKFQEKLIEKQAEKNEEDDDILKYELGKNSIFLRFRDTTINHVYNKRLINAIQFGQKLVVDCGYDKDMTNRENINCAKQLMLLFAENRIHDDPFDLHFCNVDHKCNLLKALHRNIPTMYESSFPLYLHSESYLDVFDRDQVVYLTPHCREELTNYDHDAVYIVGAIVDKVNQEPLSLARAKKEKLRMAKLPLDKHLHFGAGSGKSLTLNQVVSILLDVKHTGNWDYALRHVPRRKLTDFSAGSAIGKYDSLSYDRNNLRSRKYWKPKEKFNAETNDFQTDSSRSKRSKFSINKIM